MYVNSCISPAKEALINVVLYIDNLGHFLFFTFLNVFPCDMLINLIFYQGYLIPLLPYERDHDVPINIADKVYFQPTGQRTLVEENSERTKPINWYHHF